MKYLAAGQPPDPAPALSRGLRLLGLLAVDGQATLEQLARKTGWPKSSVLRYLTALEGAGAVGRDPATKIWEARQVLVPALGTGAADTEAARRRLPVLAAVTGQCAEYYRMMDGRVVLVDRAEPEDAPVSVNARIGYERDLGELDATACMAYAFMPALRPPKHLWCWESGRKVTVTAAVRDQRVQAARDRRLSRDHDFNSFGIRRFAVPLLSGTALTGLLAVAQRQTPQAEREIAAIEAALIATPPER